MTYLFRIGRLAGLMAVLAGAAASPVCGAVLAPSSAPAAQEPGLVGTWRLVRFENRFADGRVLHPFGEHPLGYFVYDATGHLSVQIMHNPPIATGAAVTLSFDDTAPSKIYDAYFGTYWVDKAHGVLHHVVEGGANYDYVAHPDQVRPYRLNGDTLIIEIKDEKQGMQFYRELHRVR